MTARDPLWLQAGNYTATEDRIALAALLSARHFVDLAPSTSPLVSAGGGHGVFGDGMAVSAGAGTSVNVALGVAAVRGTQQSDQGVYITSNDASFNVAISAADATNPRKDLIVTRVKDAEFAIAGDTGPIEVVTGTPTGGLTAGNATGRPTPPENALVLAEVYVPAAAASSASYTITDLRTRAYAAGGCAVCTSTTRPTSAPVGQLIYEIDTKRVYAYDGTSWLLIGPDMPHSTEAHVTAAAGTETSTSYVDLPTALSISNFTKFRADTKLLIRVDGGFWVDNALSSTSIGIDIGGTDTEIDNIDNLGASATCKVAGARQITGLAAGSYSPKVQWRVSSGDQVTMVGRWSLTVTETL